MRHKKDFYEILGVGKNCTEEEIKKSYRKVKIPWFCIKFLLVGFEIPSWQKQSPGIWWNI